MGRNRVSPKIRDTILKYFNNLSDNSYINIIKKLKEKDGIQVSKSTVQRILSVERKKKANEAITQDIKNTQITMDIYNMLEKYHVKNSLNKAYKIQKYINKLIKES